jgi:hypothetical protein
MPNDRSLPRRAPFVLALGALAAGVIANLGDDGEHPYADMASSLGTVTAVPLRGRLVREEAHLDLEKSTPAREMSQDELKNEPFDAVLLAPDDSDLLTLGSGRSDEEGYVDITFALREGAIPPGRHRVDIRVKGSSAGRAQIRLLPVDFTGLVVRSDVDLTYLDTHFARKRDMAKLLTQPAAERRTLPAMSEVYAGLRAGASGSEERPLVFISGSPRFFKRVLEAKMALDGVQQEGLFLKAFDEIAANEVSTLAPERIVSALKEQVGYKLGHLLRGRLELPKGAGEILLGDDSEADFVVYSIYHRLLSGALEGEAASDELARGGVDRAQAEQLLLLAAKVRASLGDFHPVKAIYINLTGKPNATHKVSDWPVPGLLRAHQGAWPLILDLHEEGWVSKEAIARVKTRLLALGQTADMLDQAAKAGVESGFLDVGCSSL